MKNILIRTAIILLFFASWSAEAQSFEVKISGQKKIVISELNRVRVEAYDGASIEITATGTSERPQQLGGLKAISAMGNDNTGIGLNVKSDANLITLFQASKKGEGKYLIKVPKSMSIKIEHTGNWEGGEIEVFKVSSELEISGRYNTVYMEDITGPALVTTMYGGITAKFSALSQAGPTSLVSIYDDVDVTLPENTKANLILKTPYGESYTDLNIEFSEYEKSNRSSTITGKLNGGGVNLELKASYDNIFLRKKS